MDLAVKDDYKQDVGAESMSVAAYDVAIDSQTLKDERDALQNELRQMIVAGDAIGVMRVQNQLRELPDRITAAEIAEIRQKIDAGNERLNEIKEETAYAEKIKGEKNKILGEKLKAVEEAGLAVERVNLVLYQLDSEAKSLRQARREYNQRLDKFLEDVITQSSNK